MDYIKLQSRNGIHSCAYFLFVTSKKCTWVISGSGVKTNSFATFKHNSVMNQMVQELLLSHTSLITYY